MSMRRPGPKERTNRQNVRRLPIWCSLLIRLAALLAPKANRREFLREWTGELVHFKAAGDEGLWRRARASFSDAAQLRRLSSGRRRRGLEGSERRWSLESLNPLRNLRRAARNLAHNPGFTAAAVITLGLGIGANTAIFSLINGVLLKTPAVEAPERLVRIYNSTPEGRPYGPVSYLELRDIREQTDVFEGVIGYTLAVGALTGDGPMEALLGEVVTGNYFELLGARLAAGRAFGTEEDTTPGAHPVVVLGHGLWARRFAQDPSVVGSTIKLNATNYVVIGVADESYRGMLPGLWTDFWVPSMMIVSINPDVPEALTRRTSRQFMLHARLRDGVTLDAAKAAVTTVASRLEEAYPESSAGHVMVVMAAGDVRLHPRIDAMLFPVAAMLLLVPGLVLLIACTNLAGLLLARATDRRKEIAVSLALGAGRRHVIGQLLAESALLSVAGGLAGILLASWLVDLIVSFKPPLLISLSLDVGVDHRVLLFTLGLSLVAGVLFGLVPALRASKPDLARALKDDDAVVWRTRRLSLRNALIVGQVAVSMFLLLVAGLFVRSLQEAQTIDPGFDTESSVVFTMNAALRYDESNGRDYYERLIERVSAIPGVTSAALADRLPLGLSSQAMSILVDESRAAAQQPISAAGSEPIDFARISPDYFRTLGITLVAGRDFNQTDRDGSAPVTIVSETAADYFWPGGNPVGEFLRRPGGGTLEVVGVARDTRVRTLGEAPRPFLYVPHAQNYESAVELIIATDGDPVTLLAAAQDVILQVDPEVVPLELMTMSDGNAIILFPIRMAAGLMGGFGLLALLLSSVGIAGSLAYSVAQRGHEVGVRMALGASPQRLVGSVVAGGMALVGVGMAIGLLLALATGPLISSLLVGVSPADPVAFVGISLLLAAVACVASYIPARRAAGADPLTVLRHE